ncbi:putative phage head assembly protein [environmental Halophage eHP-32]|nr:putative phage head assembly protein [environmental Halophage eHP-32]
MTHDHHAHLRELSTDPTNTTEIRRNFLKAVQRRFRDLRGAVRKLAGYEEDRFHLKQNSRLADADDIERFSTDQGKIRAFRKWLREYLDGNVLEAIPRRQVRNGEHWSATYIRAAYRRGWENARQRLQNAGLSTEEVDEIFNLGVPQSQLKRLYTRTYENLQTVAEEAAPVVADVLSEGLAEGINPRDMADRLVDEIETIQKTRAEVLARTEVINSYADATLDRYDRADVGGVSVSGEFATADDQRVCPICEAIEGTVYATNEMREATFTYEADDNEADSLGGEYPVKPPVHPQCRCAILPSIGD